MSPTLVCRKKGEENGKFANGWKKVVVSSWCGYGKTANIWIAKRG
jgi:hypothetical protein